MPFKKGHKINLGNTWNKGRVKSSEWVEKCVAHSRGKSNPAGVLARWKNHIKMEKPSPQKRYSKNPEEQLAKKRFRNQRYKASKRHAQGSHTFEQWLELKAKYFNMCLCCKQFEPIIKLTEDHIMPLSMGGSDLIENIQPLCQSCNTRKHAKFISYLPSKALFIDS